MKLNISQGTEVYFISTGRFDKTRKHRRLLNGIEFAGIFGGNAEITQIDRKVPLNGKQG